MHLKGLLRGLRGWPQASFVWGAIALSTASPTQAAERVSFQFGILGDSLSVSSLRAFVEEGTIDAELGSFLGLLPKPAQAQFRNALTQSPKAVSDAPNVVAVSQWLHGPMGDSVLEILGHLIQTPSGQNGKVALRAALVLAAAESANPNVVDILEAFPTRTVRIDLAQALARKQQIEARIKRDLALVEQVKQSSLVASQQSPLKNLGNLPDLSKPGPLAVIRQTWTVSDHRDPTGRLPGDRPIPVDIYQPDDFSQFLGPIPVVVMSHGYAVDRRYFETFARHIASHGMVAVLPEHIGSNLQQIEAFEAGQSKASFQATDFLDRPLDISRVLDELEQRNSTDYDNRLQLDRVGVVGHSYGGYTALALSGATVEFAALEETCTSLASAIDISLLLSCRATELSPQLRQTLTDGQLRDERVQFAMALSPVSRLFGPTGMAKIQIPIVMMGGVYDLAAPIATEQIEPFSWLTTPERYLYVVEHFSHQARVTRSIWQAFQLEDSLGSQFESSNAILQENLQAIGLAALKVHLSDRDQYHSILTSAYSESVSQAPFDMHLIREKVMRLPSSEEDSYQLQTNK